MKKLLLAFVLAASLAMFGANAAQAGFSDGGHGDHAVNAPLIPPCPYDTGKQPNDICLST